MRYILAIALISISPLASANAYIEWIIAGMGSTTVETVVCTSRQSCELLADVRKDELIKAGATIIGITYDN